MVNNSNIESLIFAMWQAEIYYKMKYSQYLRGFNEVFYWQQNQFTIDIDLEI